MFRAVITRSTVTSRALSPRVVMSARSFADKADPDVPSDVGLTGTTSSGDSLTKRKEAAENMYIRKQEQERMATLRKKLAEQRKHLDELEAHVEELAKTQGGEQG